MQSTMVLLSIIFLLLISKSRTQSPDDENKLYSKFLTLNSSHTFSHTISPDQVFWWTVVDGTKLNIAVSGPGSDFVAVGFSPNGGMVGSVAVIGLNNNPTPLVGVYFLGGQELDEVTQIESTNIVGSTTLTYLDGALILEFVWDTKGNNKYYNFSISEDMNMVWSWRDGPVRLDYHDGRTQSLHPLNFQTGAGAVTYTTPKCGTGIPGNSVGHVFQDPCECRGFFQPPDCVKTNLTNSHSFDSGNDNIVLLNWKVVKGIGYFDVSGSSNGWIAVGFCDSGAGLMLNMEPVIGWVDRDTGKGNVVVRYVQSGRTLSPNNRLNVSDVSAWMIDGQMGMHFSRYLSAGYNPIVNGNAFMVASKNMNDRPMPITRHTTHSNGGVIINLINGTVSIPPFEWIPAYTHALLMYISWGILFPFGVLFARYSKHLKHALWFEVHRVTQTTGFLIALAGTVVAMLMVDGSHFNTAWHAQLGASALAVMMYQICSALLRPHVEPKQKKTIQRHIFEWSHHILGRMGIIAAWVNIFAGFQQLGVSNIIVYIHAGVVGAWAALYFIYEIRMMLNRRRNYERVNHS